MIISAIFSINTSWKVNCYFYKIYGTKNIFDNISVQTIVCMIILFDKIPKKRRKNDNFSVQSIVYDYHNIQIKKIGDNFLSKVLCLWLF